MTDLEGLGMILNTNCYLIIIIAFFSRSSTLNLAVFVETCGFYQRLEVKSP